MNLPKVYIVDDHKVLRDGLKYLLSDLGIVEIAGEASNGKEFIDQLLVVKPDMVLMDINMPIMNGIEATRKALELMPDLKILILSMHDDAEFYNTMIELGVKGFVLKESDSKELEKAVQAILNGDHYFSQELLLKLIRNKNAKSAIKLSDREKDILTLICKGLSNNEIADNLHLSVRTVEKYRSDLLVKTESSNSISLAIYAIKNQLVEI